MAAVDVLSRFEFYQRADAARRALYEASAASVHLPEGAAFYAEGDFCPHFGLVGHGDIRVYKASPAGRELTLYHVTDGQPCLVNMLCVCLSRGAMASAVAETPTDAVVVPAGVVRNWIASDETFRSFVFETMAARLVDVMTLAADLSTTRMEARLAGLLLRLGDRQAGTIEATHAELAVELGTAREVISRLVKEFERAGALQLGRGYITVTDKTLLQGISSPADPPHGL